MYICSSNQTKSPSLAISYRPINSLSTIMNLFEQFIEKGLRKHLEDTGFLRKYQSGFRNVKSTNDHIFHLYQPVTESFNKGELVSFLDFENFFHNVCRNGLRHNISSFNHQTPFSKYTIIIFLELIVKAILI